MDLEAAHLDGPAAVVVDQDGNQAVAVVATEVALDGSQVVVVAVAEVDGGKFEYISEAK